MNAFCSHTVFYFSSPHFPPHSNSLRKAERAEINLTSEMRKLRLRVAKDIIDKSNFGGQKPRASKPMLILYTVPENCNINNRLKQNKTFSCTRKSKSNGFRTRKFSELNYNSQIRVSPRDHVPTMAIQEKLLRRVIV